MIFIAQSTEPELTPDEVVLGVSSKKKYVKSFDILKVPVEVYFGKLKRVIPYGKKFSTENAEIVEMTEAMYQIGSHVYSYAQKKLEEITLKLIKKVELKTSKKCKYKMYLATFYDEATQDVFTKYLVVA